MYKLYSTDNDFCLGLMMIWSKMATDRAKPNPCYLNMGWRELTLARIHLLVLYWEEHFKLVFFSLRSKHLLSELLCVCVVCIHSHWRTRQ